MKKLFAVLLAAVMLLSLCACDASDYKKATALYSAGSYTEAKAAFEALGDYKDSADMVKSCSYALADADLTVGNFAEAKAAFEALGSYEDSAEKVKDCAYSIARTDLDAGNLESAVEGFTALGEFKDSAELLGKAQDALATERLVGLWVSENIDVTDAMVAGMELADEEISSYFDFGTIYVTMDVEFTANGTYTTCLNKDQYLAAIDGMVEPFTAGFTQYMTDYITEEASSIGYTLEAFLAECGVSTMEELIEISLDMSVDEYADLLFGETLRDLADSLPVENGTYSVESGTLRLYCGTVCETGSYDPDSDTFTILGLEGAETDENSLSAIAAGTYPITCHRAG